MTTIRYFIPEDGDMEAQPNVFLAPKPRQQGYAPSLGQVKHAFPLPGRYHFRFKSPIVPGADREKGAMPVWLDCVDDRQPIPTWRGTAMAKVTRIGIEEDDDDDEDFHRNTPTSAAPAPPLTHATPAPAQQQQPPQPSVDLFGGHTPSARNNSQPSSGQSSTANLMDAHAPPPQQGSGETLLDMNYGNQQHQNDFLGMSSNTTSPPNYGGQQQQPNNYHRQASGQSNHSHGDWIF